MKIKRYQEKSFNSTLVQLKGYDTVGKYTNNISFNSTLVQLKAVYGTHPSTVKTRFNSTLVQLKANHQQPSLGYDRVSILPQFN